MPAYNSSLTGAQIDEAIAETIPSLQTTLNELYEGKVLSDATVADVSTMFTFRKRASAGTPAAGMGMRDRFLLSSSTTIDQEAVRRDIGWVVATHASYQSYMAFYLADAGALNTTNPAVYMTHVNVPQASGNLRRPALGIGVIPTRVFCAQFSSDAATTLCLFDNTNTTDQNGIVVSFRSTTTGTGAAANTELAGFRSIFVTHDHPTRKANFEFFIVNAGTYEVFKFRENRTFGYGDLTYASFTQLLSTRKTGWTAATGTKARTTFVTDSVTLPNLAARVGALLDDLISHGLIGT